MPIRLIALPLMALLAVAGCETLQGAGQDLQNAGEAVQDGAQQLEAELN
jgi:predicted small secreted protein